MSKSDQIDEIEQQLRNLQLSSQDISIKREHERELHARMKDLQNDSTQEFECQQAEGASNHSARDALIKNARGQCA